MHLCPATGRDVCDPFARKREAAGRPHQASAAVRRAAAGRDMTPAIPAPVTAKPSDDRGRPSQAAAAVGWPDGLLPNAMRRLRPCPSDDLAKPPPPRHTDAVPATSLHLHSSASTSGDHRTSGVAITCCEVSSNL